MLCRFNFRQNSININPIVSSYIWYGSNSICFITSFYCMYNKTNFVIKKIWLFLLTNYLQCFTDQFITLISRNSIETVSLKCQFYRMKEQLKLIQWNPFHRQLTEQVVRKINDTVNSVELCCVDKPRVLMLARKNCVWYNNLVPSVRDVFSRRRQAVS